MSFGCCFFMSVGCSQETSSVFRFLAQVVSCIGIISGAWKVCRYSLLNNAFLVLGLDFDIEWGGLRIGW